MHYMLRVGDSESQRIRDPVMTFQVARDANLRGGRKFKFKFW